MRESPGGSRRPWRGPRRPDRTSPEPTTPLVRVGNLAYPESPCRSRSGSLDSAGGWTITPGLADRHGPGGGSGVARGRQEAGRPGLRIYDGSPRQDFEEVFRAIGAVLDERGYREVLIDEVPDGFIVQGL